MPDTRVLAGGLGFPESPRWHDGRLYLSDMAAGRVASVDVTTGVVSTVIAKVPGRPSGLTWDDGGRLLVVSMGRSAVFRDDGGDRLTLFADLSRFGGGWRNDAVRHPDGWLYVSALGSPENGGLVDLVMVDRRGTAEVAATALAGPNGMAIAADGRTLIVNEYSAGRLTAFTIGAGGTLADRRGYAAADDWRPDGCCIDADGAMWVASAGDPVVKRVTAGGHVVDEVTAQQPAFACMLAGHDRRTLCICTAPSADSAAEPGAAGGCIETAEVTVPGAGWP